MRAWSGVYFSKIQLIPMCLCRQRQKNAWVAAGCLAAVFPSKSKQQHKYDLYLSIFVHGYLCNCNCVHLCAATAVGAAGVFTSKSEQVTLPAYC